MASWMPRGMESGGIHDAVQPLRRGERVGKRLAGQTPHGFKARP